MLLAHKVELRPTKEQYQKLLQWCGTSRHCRNNVLAHFKENGEKFTKKAAREHLYNVLRVANPWYGEVSQATLQESINDVEDAYKRFFKGLAEYPAYRKKGVRDSFSIRQPEKFSVVDRHLFFEKFNKGRNGAPLKMRERLRFEGKAKQLTISFRGGKFYASILVEVESGYKNKTPKDLLKSVGVDLGVKELAVTSDGKFFEANQKLKASLKRLSRKQRKLSRQKKGSNRRAKTKRELSKLHKRIADQRHAALHNLSDYLTSNYGLIKLEDLNVSGMMKNGNLSRAVADCGFYELRRQIEYKAFLRGGRVEIINQWFPSSKTCSVCGWQDKDLTLGDRNFNCKECGNDLDRDLNAAINILNYDGKL